MNLLQTTSFLAALVVSSIVFGQEDFARIPLPSLHPLIGTWRIELPDQKCFEEYELHVDGTKSSRSSEERNESEFQISTVPSSRGFYKWTDKIVKVNGKPDCSGSKTDLGHVAVNYVRVHPSGDRFLLCEAEEMKSCFAEFNRKKVQ
jgi:hypothetical protein